jgi:hypothetical protein
VSTYGRRLELGDTIGAYRIEGWIGRGGMGSVYLAHHLRLDRRAALKVLLPELADDNAFRDRFIRESQLAASIDHPHVIPIYDADERDGVLYIAMRYVEGSDLKSELSTGGLPSVERTAAIVQAVGAGLDSANFKGLVHRDVKPANILIERPTGHVFVTDFGLAKIASGRSMTGTGTFLGTIDYCAPEQIEGRPVDGRTDVYALGCVLYECLTRRPPFVRDSDVAVVKAHLTDPPPLVSASRPDLPPAVDRVVVTAMAKDPDQRFASCGRLGAALKEALAAGGSTVAAVGVGPTFASATAQSPQAPRPQPTAPGGFPPPAPPPVATPPRRRRRGLLWAAIAVLVVAAAATAGAVLALRGGTHTPPPRAASIRPGVSRRLTTISADQRTLNGLLQGLGPSSTALDPLVAAAHALDGDAVDAQNYAFRVTSVRSAERPLFVAFKKALRNEIAYAGAIAALPSTTSDLTKTAAQNVVDAAGSAESSFTVLSGTDTTLPTVPVRRADAVILPQLVPPPPPPTTTTTTVITTTTPSTTTTPQPGARQEIQATILGHWAAINAGSYDLAFSYFSPAFQARVGASSWVTDKQRDRPTTIGPVMIRSVYDFGTTGQAYVGFRTFGQETSSNPYNTGCNDWSGHYDLVLVSGTWKIDDSKLNRTPLDRSACGG